jgi:excisionase family DNA binding protein
VIKLKTVKEVAKELRVSTNTVYNWAKKGKIKVVRIDKGIRIPESEIEAKPREAK